MAKSTPTKDQTSRTSGRTAERTSSRSAKRGSGRAGRAGGRRAGRAATRKSTLVLNRSNYRLIALGVLLIVTGFVIMRMDNQVEGFVSLYVAPLVIIAGYVGVGYGVVKK